MTAGGAGPAGAGAGPRRGALPDGLLLAAGTLTALRVPAPSRVDRPRARVAMLAAPLVGLGLAAAAAAAALVGRFLTGGPDLDPTGTGAGRWAAADLLSAVLTVAVLAWATRAVHLDGLADTVDGLGSGREAAGALEVMRRSDAGPMGAAALVLVLLAQVAALTVSFTAHHGTAALATAVVTGRLSLVWACTPAVPAARPDGLGAAVAGSVPRAAAWALTAAVLVAAVAIAALDDDNSRRQLVLGPLGVLAGLGAAGWLRRRCVRRLGGVTGDVLGAGVEVSTLAAALVLAAA